MQPRRAPPTCRVTKAAPGCGQGLAGRDRALRPPRGSAPVATRPTAARACASRARRSDVDSDRAPDARQRGRSRRQASAGAPRTPAASRGASRAARPRRRRRRGWSSRRGRGADRKARSGARDRGGSASCRPRPSSRRGGARRSPASARRRWGAGGRRLAVEGRAAGCGRGRRRGGAPPPGRPASGPTSISATGSSDHVRRVPGHGDDQRHAQLLVEQVLAVEVDLVLAPGLAVVGHDDDRGVCRQAQSPRSPSSSLPTHRSANAIS